MKTDFKTESFYEKENQCAQLFSKNGPFWHLCTNGQNSFIIFAEEADYDIGLALLAATACLFPDITILTFEFMSNHIHILLSGRKDRCFDFFDYFKSKLIRTWKKSGKIVNWEDIRPTILWFRFYLIYLRSQTGKYDQGNTIRQSIDYLAAS